MIPSVPPKGSPEYMVIRELLFDTGLTMSGVDTPDRDYRFRELLEEIKRQFDQFDARSKGGG